MTIIRIPAPTDVAYSLASWAGDTLFLTGQIGIDANGKIVDGGVAAQTSQAINNINQILHLAGLNLENVVKCNVWISDENHFAEYNAAYREMFGGIKPARSTMICDLLAGALIEIEAIATRST